MKPVGKPDTGNPHVRFDERGGETGRESDAAPFLDSTGILSEPGQLTVTYRHDDRTGENAFQQEQAVKKLLLLAGLNVTVTFLPYRRRHPQDDFHDRLVNVIAVAPEAMAGEHSFELTGGIDRLMGERFETRVFYFRGEVARAAPAQPHKPQLRSEPRRPAKAR